MVRPLHGQATGEPGATAAQADRHIWWIPEDMVRTIVGVAGLAGALLLAACSEPVKSVDESLKKDLELAFTESPITLQETAKSAQVVSAIERTAPQVRKQAPSRKT